MMSSISDAPPQRGVASASRARAYTSTVAIRWPGSSRVHVTGFEYGCHAPPARPPSLLNRNCCTFSAVIRTLTSKSGVKRAASSMDNRQSYAPGVGVEEGTGVKSGVSDAAAAGVAVEVGREVGVEVAVGVLEGLGVGVAVEVAVGKIRKPATSGTTKPVVTGIVYPMPRDPPAQRTSSSSSWMQMPSELRATFCTGVNTEVSRTLPSMAGPSVGDNHFEIAPQHSMVESSRVAHTESGLTVMFTGGE